MDLKSGGQAPPKRLPRAVSMMTAFSKPRHTISSPLGSVKSSRGADLIRSDTFTIVNGIDNDNPVKPVTAKLTRASPKKDKDCSSSDSSVLKEGCHNKRTPPKGATISSSSSVPLLQHALLKAGGIASDSSSSSVSDENSNPSSTSTTIEAATQASQGPVKSKIPKSRTMGVLNELKTSISRPALGMRSLSKATGISQAFRKASSSTISSEPATALATSSASSSRVWQPQASLTSLVRSSRSCTPEPKPVLPHQITQPQPSAYWSGRFMALHDRLLSEASEGGPTKTEISQALKSDRQAQPLAAAIRSPSKGNYRQLHTNRKGPAAVPAKPTSKLPHANTTSSLARLLTKPVDTSNVEEDDRCRRVFDKLDECCITTEAKQSLYDWQQTYARRYNRQSLLPVGKGMEDKGRVARFFSGASKRTPRSSLSGVHGSSEPPRLTLVL